MKSGEASYLFGGLFVGLVVGLLLGVLLSRPEALGVAARPEAPAAAAAPAAAPPSEAPPDASARLGQFLNAAQARPNDYQAQLQAGNVLFDAHRWAEAEAAYRKALALRPGDPNVMTDLGVTLFEQGRHDEALRQFEESLAKKPDHWQAAYNGVVVNKARGDLERARAWLARLKRINPNVPQIAEFERDLGAR